MEPVVVLVIIVFIVIAIGTPRSPRIGRYEYPPFPPYPPSQRKPSSFAGLKILLLLTLILGSVIFATGGIKKFLDMIDLPPKNKTEMENDVPEEAGVRTPFEKTPDEEEIPPVELPEPEIESIPSEKQKDTTHSHPTDTTFLLTEEKNVTDGPTARDTTLPQHPYTVQVVASNNYPLALSQAKKWRRNLEIPVFIGVKDPEYSHAYKILMGDFPTKAEAERWFPKLRKLTGEDDCWVRAFEELRLLRQDTDNLATAR